MCEGNHLLISQKIHTHSIKSNLKTWLEFSLLYLRQNLKPYMSNGLGLSWKFCRKKICTTFNRSSLILDRSSQADLHCKSCNNSIPTLHKKYILWKSINKTKMFWLWFANITKWSSNTLVPNSLEPNILNKWITYVLTIFPFGNPWQNHNKQMRYERSHKSLNSYSLVEYNKLYPKTNSWKTLQEESLWQVDFYNS